ncbi:MAG: methylenetetrahydrofolate reductase [NAD(P)H] [Verrucomicrobiota bacterium]
MKKPGRAISDMLQAGEPVLSVEFFPAKTEEGARQILRTANALKPYRPDFVSITYGAGGSTRERTLDYGELLQEIFGFEVMPHLTCVGHSRDDLRSILSRFKEKGFRNIMALRGDPPKGEEQFKAHPDGLRYGSELVGFIRETFPHFCLGVGGYPEKHPEATSLDADLEHLKIKMDAGADFITTQLFFKNSDYLTFVEKCRALGISKPVVPGILPPLSYDQVTKFCGFCQASLPDELSQRLEAVKDDEEASLQVGVDWAYEQIIELFEQGAPGVHLYLLNRSASALALIERLHQAGALR